MAFDNPYETKYGDKLTANIPPAKLDWTSLEQQKEKLGKEIDAWAESIEKVGTKDDQSTASGNNFGEALKANAGNILGFGFNTYQNLTSESGSKKEDNLKTGQLALGAAKVGMSLAGPWGALAAIPAAAVGVFKGKSETQRRIEEEDQKQKKIYAEREKRRAEQYALSQGKQKMQQEMDTRENQFKFNNPRYA